jgi:hypothetical protein
MIKIIGLAIVYFAILVIPRIGLAQEINGTVKSKSSTISFEDFGSAGHIFNGEIHSNLTGSKYTINLSSEQEKLEGIITNKFSSFGVKLSYKNRNIDGQIKRSTNHTRDDWDIDFFGNKLNGTVVHNAMNKADTYNLSYGTIKLTGTIHKKMNTLVYDLMLNKKKITGIMSLNATAVKHSYSLMTEQLTDDEYILFLFIESIKLMNERIDDIDDFQGND